MEVRRLRVPQPSGVLRLVILSLSLDEIHRVRSFFFMSHSIPFLIEHLSFSCSEILLVMQKLVEFDGFRQECLIRLFKPLHQPQFG